MLLWSLVLAQFALSAAIVLSARWSPLPIGSLLASSPGIGIAIWAWLTIGFQKIRIHPTTTERTELMMTGPYRLVRHPMYAGLIWFTGALLFTPFESWRAVAWCLMVAVLSSKAKIEERLMQQRFPEYESYRQRVGQLFPKLRP